MTAVPARLLALTLTALALALPAVAHADIYCVKPVTTGRLVNMVALFLSKEGPLERRVAKP